MRIRRLESPADAELRRHEWRRIMDRYLLPLIFLIAATLPVLDAQAQEKAANGSPVSFLDRLAGRSEDFTDLKQQRRKLNNEIARGDRDMRLMDSQIERLSKELEDAPTLLNRLDQEVKQIDTILAEKSAAAAKPSARNGGALSAQAMARFQSEREYLASLPSEELRSRKADREQRSKEIGDRIRRLGLLRDEHRSKRDELEAKQAQLVDLEDRIAVALNVGTNQYIYRTLVSAIFAVIVFYLVSRFFSVVQDDPDVKKSIFSGEAGIQFITLFSIVIAVILFGILEILGANELSALLGGLSGYILGKTSSKGSAQPAPAPRMAPDPI
jgi:hypothetical protein